MIRACPLWDVCELLKDVLKSFGGEDVVDKVPLVHTK